MYKSIIKAVGVAAVAVMGLATAAFAQELPRVAVYVTGDLGDNEKTAFGTRMLVPLVNSGRYRGAERGQPFLAEADRERQKLNGEAMDDNRICELARQFDIKFLCLVNIVPVFGEFQISARMLNTETVATEHIGAVASPLKSIGDLVEASEQMVKDMLGGQAAPTAETAPALQRQPEPTAPPPATPTRPKGPIKAAVYVTGIPDMVAKPLNSAVSSALMKTKIYAGIESIDVSGQPNVSALAAAGNNAGVSYIFAINVTGQVSVTIVDVAESVELAKITIDGKITAVNATVIAKKIVDFILKSGPQPDPDAQAYAQADYGAGGNGGQEQPAYKIKYAWYNEPDGKPRILKKRISVEAGGAFAPFVSVHSQEDYSNQSRYPNDTTSFTRLGGGGYLIFDLKYAEIGFPGDMLLIRDPDPNFLDPVGNMLFIAKYSFAVVDFIEVSPILGFGMIGVYPSVAGPLIFGGRVTVGMGEFAYLRSEYLYALSDGMSFKLGVGLDVGLGEKRKAYLRPELLYNYISAITNYSNDYGDEKRVSSNAHALSLRLGIGYKWGGDVRKEVRVEVKPKSDEKILSAGTGGLYGYNGGAFMFFDAKYAEAFLGTLSVGALAKVPFGAERMRLFPLVGFEYYYGLENVFALFGAGIDYEIYQDIYVRSEMMYNVGSIGFFTWKGGAGYRF